MKKFLIVAKFEYLNIVKKKSFWLSTLFFPIFMAFVMFVSGYSSVDAAKKMESSGTYQKIYVVDEGGVFPDAMYANGLIKAESIDSVKDDLIKDSQALLIFIPSDFKSTLKYELYFNSSGNVFVRIGASSVANSLFKSVAMSSVTDEGVRNMLEGSYSATINTYDAEGNLKPFGVTDFVLPIASLVVFFVFVFVSSTFMLNSVSSEKENRMIETVLSMVTKNSLMFGKVLGLLGVVFTQLLAWIVLGLIAYSGMNSYFGSNLPFHISLDGVDWSMLPLNIFLIVAGFVFFSFVMVGVGAVGAGAQDSRSLSSIFIVLAIFPMYLLQSLMTDPDSLMAKIFSYFPFTSFMTLLLRNSFGNLSVFELVAGIVAVTIYSLVSVFLSIKLFEIGCLMYNRRPTLKEILVLFK